MLRKASWKVNLVLEKKVVDLSFFNKAKNQGPDQVDQTIR